MKLFVSGSAIILLMVLSFFEVGVTSCTKDNTIYDTVTVKDTLIIKDTVLTAEILTAHPWKYQEYRGVWGGDDFVYIRGGGSNTKNFDTDYIVFYSDGTGNHRDIEGNDHLIKEWQFVNNEHTKLTFKYYNLLIEDFFTWDNIRYKNNALRYDEYFHDNYLNINVHDQSVRIPQ
ncbi:MAG: hypothetical protein WDO19_33530 [Bacteroidota bacterium]